MGRKSAVAENLLDDFEVACIALEIPEDKCQILREAAREICTFKAKKKRKPSKYNVFIGECVKNESGPVTERFKRCVLKWKEMKSSKR